MAKKIDKYTELLDSSYPDSITDDVLSRKDADLVAEQLEKMKEIDDDLEKSELEAQEEASDYISVIKELYNVPVGDPSLIKEKFLELKMKDYLSNISVMNSQIKFLRASMKNLMREMMTPGASPRYYEVYRSLSMSLVELIKLRTAFIEKVELEYASNVGNIEELPEHEENKQLSSSSSPSKGIRIMNTRELIENANSIREQGEVIAQGLDYQKPEEPTITS